MEVNKMDDLISKQAAIEWCRPEDWGTPDERWRPESEYGAMLEALPSAQQWIPCSERLPEEEKRHYWVCTDTGYQCQCRWTNDVYGLGASDIWEWKIFDIPQYQKVIAWMPLPEPYEP